MKRTKLDKLVLAERAVLNGVGNQQLSPGRLVSVVTASSKLDEPLVRTAVWGLIGNGQLILREDLKVHRRAGTAA